MTTAIAKPRDVAQRLRASIEGHRPVRQVPPVASGGGRWRQRQAGAGDGAAAAAGRSDEHVTGFGGQIDG